MARLNIYKLTSPLPFDWDKYQRVVVVAKNEQEARRIHPDGIHVNTDELAAAKYPDWCAPNEVQIELIGKAEATAKQGVILAEFNAG